ncbi:MAG: DMT family transporter, partial [Candidatus Thorarchaeota archaeon]
FIIYRKKNLISYIYTKEGWILGIFLYLSYFFQTIGLNLTAPSKAAFITGLSVPLVPIFLLVFWRAKIALINLLWAIMGFIGLALLTINLRNSLTVNIGDIIVIGTAITVAFHIIITGIYSKRIDEAYLLSSQFFIMSILATLMVILFESPKSFISINLTFQVMLALFITILFATIYAFTLQTYSQKKGISPTIVALIFTLEPVFALFTSLVLQREILTLQGAVGSLIIFLAIFFSVLTQSKKIPEDSIKPTPSLEYYHDTF